METAAARAAQHWALAQEAEAEHLEVTLASLTTTIQNLRDIGPTSPPDIRTNARRLADSLQSELENLQSLRERSKPQLLPLAEKIVDG